MHIDWKKLHTDIEDLRLEDVFQALGTDNYLTTVEPEKTKWSYLVKLEEQIRQSNNGEDHVEFMDHVPSTVYVSDTEMEDEELYPELRVVYKRLRRVQDTFLLRGDLVEVTAPEGFHLKKLGFYVLQVNMGLYLVPYDLIEKDCLQQGKLGLSIRIFSLTQNQLWLLSSDGLEPGLCPLPALCLRGCFLLVT